MTDAQINLEIRLHSGRIEIAILLRLIMLPNSNCSQDIVNEPTLSLSKTSLPIRGEQKFAHKSLAFSLTAIYN